tara:strand:+ start:242 stop:1327 length:1086 start_codon:yes stop_codon:yes gene_type:complete
MRKLIGLYVIFSFLCASSLWAKASPQKEKTSPKQKQTIWKLQAQSTENTPDFKILKDFSKKIKDLSNNKFIIEIIPSGKKAIASGANLFEAVKSDKVEMAKGWPNYWHQYDSGWAAIQGVPFGFMNYTSSMMYMFEGEGIKLANDLAKPHGIIWRPAWWIGMEMGILTKTEVKKLADLKDKRIRVGPGVSGETFNDAAKNFSIPTVPEKIPELLKVNMLFGVEWTVPAATYARDYHKQLPYIIGPAVWQPSSLSDFLINEKAYNKLSQKQREILELSIKSLTLSATLKGKKMDIEALEKFKKDGVKISKWSEEDMKIWKKSAEKIISKYEKKSPSFKKIMDSKRMFMEQYKSYFEIFGAYD